MPSSKLGKESRTSKLAIPLDTTLAGDGSCCAKALVVNRSKSGSMKNLIGLLCKAVIHFGY